MSHDEVEDFNPKIAELQRLADESKHDNPDPTGELHSAAEATLSVRYNEPNRWGINYTLPRGAIISINSKMPVELAMAQIRGMLADFAGRK